MANNIKILTGILVFQIVLVVFLNSQSSKLAKFESEEKLLGFSLDQVDKIEIVAKDNPDLILSRKDKNWFLPTKSDFPVSSSKFKQFTDKLFSVSKPWPVGKTSHAAKQFKLSDEEFERKISFFKGEDKLQTLYVGSSPGFKRVHVRLDGEDLSYVIKFSAYEAAIKESNWYDKELLHIEKEDISKITLKDLSIVNRTSGFQVEGLAEGEQTVSGEMSTLLSRLTRIGFMDVLGVEDKPEYNQAKPDVEYKVSTKENEDIEYKMSGPFEENFYVLKTSKYPYFFKIAKATMENVKNVERGKLVEVKAAPEEATAKKEEQANADKEKEEG